jgi:hypothetical protein
MPANTISDERATLEAWELGETWLIKAHFLGTDWPRVGAFDRLDSAALDQLGRHVWEIDADDHRPVVLLGADAEALRTICA